MKDLLLPNHVPGKHGLAYNHEKLYVISPCCAALVNTNPGDTFECDACKLGGANDEYWSSWIRLSDIEKNLGDDQLAEWAKFWTGLDDVEIRVGP